MLRRHVRLRDLRVVQVDLLRSGGPRQWITPVKKGPETDSPEADASETDSSDSLSRRLPRGWTAQYTPDYEVSGKIGKEFCETGVALHLRLQDRASFGDYCRGATPG